MCTLKEISELTMPPVTHSLIKGLMLTGLNTFRPLLNATFVKSCLSITSNSSLSSTT